MRVAARSAMPGLGCRLPADREAAGPSSPMRSSRGIGGGPDAPRLARALLARRVAEVLDNPGPAYETDPATGDSCCSTARRDQPSQGMP